MNVIMYHYVRPKSLINGNLRYLKLNEFKKQLDYFDKHYGFLTKEEFTYNFKNKVLSEKVILTFDDGLLDHYKYVYPLLKERNLTGLFFIPTSILTQKKIINVHKIHFLLKNQNHKEVYFKLKNKMEELNIEISSSLNNEAYSYSLNDKYELKIKKTLNFMIDFEDADILTDELLVYFKLSHRYFSKLYISENNISEMFDNGQIIGSHSVSHRLLSSLDKNNQSFEIKNSFKELSKYISPNFKSISYPYGYRFSYNKNTFKVLDSENVDYAFIFDNKKNHSFDKYEISRIDCNKYIL